MADLKLRGVTKKFGPVDVIKGVDLDVEDKEFVVFVGPSGCGKSTLLRLISGLEDITGGTIDIGGRCVNDVPPSKRGVAMVFQSYALYPHLNVFDNIAFGLRVRKLASAEIRTRVEDASAVLKLDALMERYPRELSGGQRQRVAIGRTIVSRPDVFLLDEPLSNLDAELRVHMRAEIASLHKRLANTMIYVTHDQIEAMTLADKIVVLNDGLVEQVGSPRELYARPRNLFVAQFIGSPKINVFPTAALPPAVAGLIGTAKGMTKFGIRPEHLTLTSPDASPLTGRVMINEYTGAGSLLHVDLDGLGSGLALYDGVDGPDAGDAVGLSFDPQNVHRFDADGVTCS